MSKIISRNSFLEIKNTLELKNPELDTIFNELFNNHKNWRITYKSVIFKQDISNIDKTQNEIKSLLNKISNSNFNEIKKKIIILCDKEELINFSLEYIFNIAIKQPLFSNFYVQIVKEFIENNKVKDTYIEQMCNNYKNLVTSNNVKNNKHLSYDDFCNNNILKQSKVGYSQFFGELFLNDIININVITENIHNMFNILKLILNENKGDVFIEDVIICINKLILTIKDHISIDYTKETIENIVSVYDSKLIIKRLKFKLMDLKDLLELKLNE
jgi:hypothetical protein